MRYQSKPVGKRFLMVSDMMSSLRAALFTDADLTGRIEDNATSAISTYT